MPLRRSQVRRDSQHETPASIQFGMRRGIALYLAAAGRDDAPEPPHQQVVVRRSCRHDGATADRRRGARGAGVHCLDGISGRLCTEATPTEKINDWCASHVRCFEDTGWSSPVVVTGNIRPAAIRPSRYESVLNKTCAEGRDRGTAPGVVVLTGAGRFAGNCVPQVFSSWSRVPRRCGCCDRCDVRLTRT